MHVHLVGVAGTGMAALAGLIAEAGHEVSGSDVAFHPPMGPALQGWGVKCHHGFRPEHLEPKPDLVVIGNVCRKDNPEARAALDRGLNVTHIAGALQRFALEGTTPVVIAGTHGKTTTASLCAWLAEHAELRPGFFIGGIAENFGRGFRRPSAGAPMILEGDEYDTAFFEKTAKFLHYRAEHAIVTSIEHDHIDIYPTQQTYEAAFARFIAELPTRGVLVAHAGDERVRQLVRAHARCNVHWYGSAPAGSSSASAHAWTAELAPTEPRQMAVFHQGDLCARLALPLLGEHNLLNALAAVVLLRVAFDVPWSELQQGLASFRGSKRRQELLGTPYGVSVYDDFAHHPTAVRETLKALRAEHPQGRLWAVFEPRSATACRRLHQAAYGEAFGAADRVLLAPVARTDLPSGEQLSTQELAATLSAQGIACVACPSIAEVQAQLLGQVQPGDTVALLSNGAFGGIHANLIRALSARESTV